MPCCKAVSLSNMKAAGKIPVAFLLEWVRLWYNKDNFYLPAERTRCEYRCYHPYLQRK